MNVVYLVIFLLANDGVTSQAIPQANLAQCQLNAKVFVLMKSFVQVTVTVQRLLKLFVLQVLNNL